MDSANPTVSAIVPVYNGARFLAYAVASARHQSVPPQEIIVVDDGSTDGTSEVARDLAGAIVYVRQANAGPAAARNHGVARATGEWVAFLDADDQWRPDKLAVQLAVIEKYPEVGMVFGDAAHVSGHRTVFRSMFEKNGLVGSFLGEGPMLPTAFERLLHCNYIPTSSALVRRGIFEEVGGFDPALRYVEDLDLWFRVAARHRVGFVHDVVVDYREHGANTSGDVEAMTKAALDVMKKLAGNAPAVYEELVRRRLARAGMDLGYYYLREGRNRDARRVLFESLTTQWDMKVAGYWLATVMGWKELQRCRTLLPSRRAHRPGQRESEDR
jgi:glycosyltransferase involved in cell wall biosynthesis